NPEKEIIKVKRAQIPQRSVSAHYKINTSTAYIRINVFSETTYDEFYKALQELKKQPIQHLIIDVRDNPGGYMDAVTRIADELIDGKKLLLSTKGKNDNEKVYSHPGGLFTTGKVSILINENAASASEILAGCIQDLDRGVVIGRRSFGKGLVQEQFELPGQAAIRITTARYYLPSGRCIQKSYKEGNTSYQHDIAERYLHGKLTSTDSISTQLKKFYTLKKRIVYEGEGIRPDQFIPVDTMLDRFLEPVFAHHLVEQSCHRYYYFHRQELSEYKTLETFSKSFTVPPQVINDIHQFSSTLKPSYPASLSMSIERQIHRYCKAEFAQLLFHENGWMYEFNQDDSAVKAALEN
ncbi:MAG TPA: S41 family peptidase, partial [Chitinophagaceae bacterium]|nr:S41 family peptidase [Chitinophagaceae bacterium]